MPTTYNQFDFPASTDAPDGPGAIFTLATEIDARLGIAGAEPAANLAAITAIPTARCFEGKMAYAVDTGWRYRYTSGAWALWETPPVAFTPAWAGGLTVGNATQYGRWKVTAGKLLDVFTNLVLGSTSAVTGAMILTLPNSFAMNNINGGYRFPLGESVFYDQSAGNDYYGAVTVATATTVIPRPHQLNGTVLGVVDPSSTVPMTWAAPDQLSTRFRALLA